LTQPKGRSKLRAVLIVYGCLLALSYLVSALREPAEPRSSADQSVEIAAVELAYRELRSELGGSVVVLLHGSPGSSSDFDRMIELGAFADRRVLIPDLPGFGRSALNVPNYSVKAHARYLLALTDRLQIEQVDLVGFSMGGGVALEFAALAPEKVRSTTLLSAIGVQELEMFGDYALNHLVHGAQLAALRWLPRLLPHFGFLDGGMLSVPYARNFYDTDQRSLRPILEQYSGPMLIVHGKNDFLVPVEAAFEHSRLVPQSELALLDTGHFHVFMDPNPAVEVMSDFLERLDRGLETRRISADPARLSESFKAFDPNLVPPFSGPSLLVVLLLIALATLVSEDLTCIGAGLLVAQGRIDLFSAAAACFFGILVGDMLLYLAGRIFGRPALEHAPLFWFVKPEAVDRAAKWFEERGGRVVFLSRFVPGLRLPTYVAAGVLRQPFLSFALYFTLAGLLWTPLFVAIASWSGAEAQALIQSFESWALPVVIGLVVSLLALQRIVVPAFTHRGRRMLAGKWLRIRRWEFWPAFVFYVPVVFWILWLAIKHRSLALVTAANPGIPTGGFIGESKSEILDSLRDEDSRIARYCLLRADWEPSKRKAHASEFVASLQLELPLVLKPDVGQRGSGVQILRDSKQFETALDEFKVDSVLQEFTPGVEFGLFYVRKPSDAQGRIFSITEKRLPTIEGDGSSTVEQLIIRDSRAVAQLDVYLDANADRLSDVLPAGERMRLVELGTHCLGAIFANGERLNSEALREAVESVSSRFEGFYFGRYDVIAPSSEALQAGEFKVIELNGLTAEATHIYDASTPLIAAYRVLFEQWSLAFQIAAECRDRGTKPATLLDLIRETLRYRKLSRGH
jgi:pimeloyl-ACP methyl ester carboxylesterase/membrane protein DedA with SNARE-associated domain